jgi:penicillin-binding protein 1B
MERRPSIPAVNGVKAHELSGIGNKPVTPDATHPANTPPATTHAPIVRPAPNTPPDGNAPDTTQAPAPKKKNFLQKIFGGGKDKQQPQQPQPTPPPQ